MISHEILLVLLTLTFFVLLAHLVFKRLSS